MGNIGSDDGLEVMEADPQALEKERYHLLQQLADWLEVPMLVLAFAWLALLAGELIWGENLSFHVIGTAIWIVFIVHFAVEFTLAPRKLAYLKGNWLTAISLLVPALRIFRVVRLVRLLRVARVGRGLRLVRIVSSLNRGMGALGASLHRRGFGYVASLTLLMVFGGAAGMYAFESGVRGGLSSYGEAVWWTAMIITTMGSQYWPQTFEGRVLCIFLSLYAFAVFGYVTATLATYFVGRDTEDKAAVPDASMELAAIRQQLDLLRGDISKLADR